MKVISTDNAPRADNILSQATESNGLIFVSGQIHKTPGKDGLLVGANISEKTRQVISNIENILKASGSGISKVVKVTVYLTDMSEYSQFNEEYTKYFSLPFPAREVVCVKELPLGASIEMSVIAEK